MSEPNAVLPKGGKLLKPALVKEVGGWKEMTYDAKVRYLGIRWLRVKGGMGDRYTREDWVADLKDLCISVHDYEWVKERQFGSHFYPSFEAALRCALEKHLLFIGQKIKEAEVKLKSLTSDQQAIKKALEK